MKKLTVLSVNISEKKGTIKKSVNEIFVEKTGIRNDAHASNEGIRQVSLLGTESIYKFVSDTGKKIEFGEFAENITTEGILLYELNVGDKLQNENVILEVSQIGKECHGTTCNIFKQVGKCIMPTEGIFCIVLKEGILKPNDSLFLVQK